MMRRGEARSNRRCAVSSPNGVFQLARPTEEAAKEDKAAEQRIQSGAKSAKTATRIRGKRPRQPASGCTHAGATPPATFRSSACNASARLLRRSRRISAAGRSEGHDSPQVGGQQSGGRIDRDDRRKSRQLDGDYNKYYGEAQLAAEAATRQSPPVAEIADRIWRRWQRKYGLKSGRRARCHC